MKEGTLLFHGHPERNEVVPHNRPAFRWNHGGIVLRGNEPTLFPRYVLKRNARLLDLGHFSEFWQVLPFIEN